MPALARCGGLPMPGHEGVLPRAARLAQVVQESARVRRFVLDARVEADPGQFVMLWLPGVDERPFSLVSPDPITLLVSRVGAFTEALHGLQQGDWVWWRGPLGHGFSLPSLGGCSEGEQAGQLLLVGGGYGVAPLLFLAHRARVVGWPARVAIGARTHAQLLLHDELAALGCHVQVGTEDGSCGHKGLVTEVVERELAASALRQPSQQVRFVYGCGPQAMLDALRTLCCQRRLPCQLSYEAVIKCAVGVCGSCARDGLLVCRDGPVLEWSADDRPWGGC